MAKRLFSDFGPVGFKKQKRTIFGTFGPGLDGDQWKSVKSIEINKISIENQEKSMPAAMESSQNIENPLEISIFSLNFFENVFFFGNLGKSPRISRICSEISPAGLGISRPGSRSLGPAEILRISQPRKIGFRRCPYRQNFLWWDASFRSR